MERNTHQYIRMNERELRKAITPRTITVGARRPLQRNTSGSSDSSAESINVSRRNISELSLAMLVLIFAGLLMTLVSRSSIVSSSEVITGLISYKNNTHKKVISVEETIRLLLDDISAIDNDASRRKDKTVISRQQTRERKHLKEVNILKRKVNRLNERAGSFKEHIQIISKKDTIKKYGPGVHKVEIVLAFPDDKLNAPTTFVIELASLDIMPHSVFIFLEMVSTGVLDGCSFILNVLHVLKTAPIPYDGSSVALKAKAFKNHGLETGVAFREYSHAYPHNQYTVGFAADDSPSFYINTKDNTDLHQGDPCFGTVVKGFETIERLQNFPTKNGIWFEEKIGIKSARIL